MQIKLKNKFLTPLFLVVCYWFYFNICFGYSLSKIFYDFFDEINKTDLSKSIQFRKKFNLENIKKFVISYILKFFENWIKRIGHKFLLLIDAINKLIKALKIFRKKFKSILKFKYNFRLLKILLLIFWEIFVIFCSFVNEIFFLTNIINWLIKWGNFIQLLMTESILITRIVYGLYFILLGIFGILVGFLLGIYRREDEIYGFLLLLLLQILYNNGFDEVLLEILSRRSLEPGNIEEFSKFSLKSIEQINPRPLKITLKEPDKIPEIPFPILGDPFGKIEIDFISDESKNYEFKLFKLYRKVNQKVKS